MEMQERLKPIARSLRKEWLSLKMEKVGASKHQFGIILKSSMPTMGGEPVALSALLTPGVTGEKHINLVMDVALPKVEDLEPVLPALSAFMQQATAVLSPMTIIVDMRTSQIILRQSQLIPLDEPPATAAFVKASQILVPLLKKTIESICEINPAPADARQMADMLAESFYGVLQE